MVRAAASCALLLGLLGGSAYARPDLRADVVERAISVSRHGQSLRVTDLVRNIGTRAASPSTAGYYLGRVRIGRRAVPGLAPGRSSRGSVTLAIPAAVPPGSYRLRACADDRTQIHESNERNNCRRSVDRVKISDGTPPSFAGLRQATTCIPGPVGGGILSSHYFLQWDTATDDVTRSSAIVYDVYQASTAGSEHFAAPTYTTRPGATTFSTPSLPDDTSYYFVVRARDETGNRDTNRVERLGVNLCY